MIPEDRISLRRGDGELVLFRYGPLGGRPILAIHGVTSSHLAWQFMADELVARGYTVWAPDLRGRGDANAVGGPYGMRVHAEDLIALLDAAGLERVDVIGHSMGAFVAVALQYLHPDRVARLMLVDGGVPLALPAGVTVEQVMPLILGPALARLAMEFASIDEYRNFWQENPAFAQRGWGVELDRYIAHDLRGPAGCGRPSTTAEAVSADSADLWGDNVVAEGLVALVEPVTMLRAERGLQNEPGGLYPEAVLPVVAAAYPKVAVVTIADTNHYDIIMSAEGARMSTRALFAEGLA